MPKSTQIYSEIFCQTKDDSWDMKNYLVDYLDDIESNINQVMLKSTLHNQKSYTQKNIELAKNLTVKILQKYPAKQESLDLLEKAIHKRDDGELVALVKKFIKYKSLDMQLDDKKDVAKKLKL